MGKTELVPYYGRAQELLELDPVPGGEAPWDVHGLHRPGFDAGTLASGFWQFDTKADRFAAHNALDLFRSPRVRVVTHASVPGRTAGRWSRSASPTWLAAEGSCAPGSWSSPNPDSRVHLNGERDALGMPRLSLQWRFQDIDKHTVVRTMHGLGAELERLGLGRLEPEPWLAEPAVSWRTDPLISNHPIGGYHHMGTTRMASSPREGVVDGNARVFGIDNLYLAGSSVFPTSGWANPTLTILALTLRLADHLDAQLRPAPDPGTSTAGSDRRATPGQRG